MKSLLALLLSLISSSIFAQNDTSFVYTDLAYNQVKPEQAEIIFKVYRKDSTSWLFATYDKRNVIISKETYRDSTLTIKHGQYLEYKKGKISLKGIYAKGMKIGKFINYDTLGNVTGVSTYELDTLNGPNILYWLSGAKQQEGVYFKGKRFGDWKVYYENGNLASKENYSKLGELLESNYFDMEGKPTTKDKIETPPIFPGGMDKFYKLLGDNIKFPPDFAERNIHGSVLISFMINETGALEDIKVEKKLHPQLDQEALRVVKQSPKWIPGTLIGKPIKVKYSMPISFNIIN